jgi:hypothetical protein
MIRYSVWPADIIGENSSAEVSRLVAVASESFLILQVGKRVLVIAPLVFNVSYPISSKNQGLGVASSFFMTLSRVKLAAF